MLSHIPGPPALPILEHNFQILADPYGTQQAWIKQYGNVYKTRMLGKWRVNLCGSQAIEHVLTDKDKIFSSKHGWDALSRVFAGGLIVQDFDIHRRDRRILTEAFRADQIRAYKDKMYTSFPTDEPFDFYERIKEETLKIGASIFMGIEPQNVNEAVKAQIRATVTPIRWAIPGTPMWKGLRARKFLIEKFRKLISERKINPGPDFFSQMCVNQGEWTEDELLDHFNLLIMAAHDTTSTTMTVLIDALSRYPYWQRRLRNEAYFGDLRDRKMTDMVIKECLRLVPPVPFIPRQTTTDTTFDGYFLPAGTSVVVNPGTNMMDPSVFNHPTIFDPTRFMNPIDKWAWTPFGGGAHKCLGMHFAFTQIKTIVGSILRRYRIEGPIKPVEWQRMPIPKPKNGLPIVFRRL